MKRKIKIVSIMIIFMYCTSIYVYAEPIYEFSPINGYLIMEDIYAINKIYQSHPDINKADMLKKIGKMSETHTNINADGQVLFQVAGEDGSVDYIVSINPPIQTSV